MSRFQVRGQTGGHNRRDQRFCDSKKDEDEEISSESSELIMYGVDKEDTFITIKNVKSNPRSFRNKLDKYNEDFTEDILDKAFNVHNKIDYSQNRGKNQTKKEFVCIYLALQEMGQPRSIKSLIPIFELTEGEAQKAINKYTSIKKGFVSSGATLNAASFIPGKVKQYNLTEEAGEEIMSLTERILNKETSLREKQPNYLCEAIIKYYCEINGIKIKNQIINDTIKKMYQLVMEIENK
jgi:hypothetical protein